MTDKSVVPEGMKAYGPEHPDYPNEPKDWDKGPYMCRDGAMYQMRGYGWRHGMHCSNPTADWDRIAYTPKSNPLNLETSDLDPITPEEDALATAIIAAEGVTRQSLHGVVRAIRAGLAKAGAVIVPVQPTEAMRRVGAAAIEDTDLADYVNDKPWWGAEWTPCAEAVWSAMLSAHSIQSGGEGGEAK